MLFRSNQRLTFKPAEGMKVVLGGRVSIYERDGQYQLYVETMAPEGVGSLFAAFEELKSKLAAQGLFDPEWKQPLPKIPTRIGVITSPTGAAVRDILTTLNRRYPQAEVLVVPVLVQGPEASEQIAAAISFLNGVPRIDVIIVGRGGGSIEELWAFNEEVVARAIFASRIPIVSAVGHETDFTIADFVADVRAATPTAAAEIVVPDQREIAQYLHAAARRMSAKITSRLEQDRRYVERLALSPVLTRPTERVDQVNQLLDNLTGRLDARLAYLLQGYGAKVNVLSGKLEALSPEAVLARGFAICQDEDGNVLRNAIELAPGNQIRIRLQYGGAKAEVKETFTEESK